MLSPYWRSLWGKIFFSAAIKVYTKNARCQIFFRLFFSSHNSLDFGTFPHFPESLFCLVYPQHPQFSRLSLHFPSTFTTFFPAVFVTLYRTAPTPSTLSPFPCDPNIIGRYSQAWFLYRHILSSVKLSIARMYTQNIRWPWIPDIQNSFVGFLTIPFFVLYFTVDTNPFQEIDNE